MTTHNLLIAQDHYKGTYRAIAGDVSLDFVNTLDWRITDQHYDWLDRYDNLVYWAHMVHLIDATDVAHLLELDLPHAQDVLQQALILREAIYRIMVAIRLHQVPSNRDLVLLNGTLQHGLTHLSIAPQGQAFAWQWGSPAQAEQLLGQVAWATSHLLLSSDLHKLGACEACGWLFIDTTKNHSRRWCTMESCGNREKVRKHRQKSR